MPYENIPGVRGTYLDGAFHTPTGSSQPEVLVIGTATSGLTEEKYSVANVRQGEDEFGAATELFKGVHETLAQGADNISVMRIGGRRGSWEFEDSDGNTLTIVPEYKDASILASYALIVESDGSGGNRYLLWDVDGETWVYDSLETLIINGDEIELVDTGIDTFTLGDKTDPTAATTLAAVLTGDFTATGSATAATVTATAGSDGTAISLVEKYAALNTAYHLLDFKDADYVLPQGVYIDDQNVVDGDTCDYFKGVPALGSTTDTLGYVWQKIHQGKLYTYFVDSPTYFTDEGTAAFSTVTVNTDLVLTALITGVGGDNISIVIDDTGAAGPTVTITEPTADTLLITVVDDGTSDTTTTVGAINTALGLYTTTTGVLADTLVIASGGGVTTLSATAATPLASGAGGHVLTHAQLTGEAIPTVVSTAFTAGADAELREVNFAHQLASFCYLASTTWKTMFGCVSFKAPTGFSRAQTAAWMGELPTYTDQGTYQYIDSPADNGSGVLGNKFLAGAAITSDGYRAHLVTDGNSTDGFAYGGFILTRGASLPDGPKWAYGVDSSDEALDANKKPIDIGKHIFVSYDWPIHRNAYNGGASYRGALSNLIAGILTTLPEKEEPIGVNGVAVKITSPPRVHSTQIDAAASIRAIGLRRDEDAGWILVSAKTAAHPNSDYLRSSTTRSVNRHLDGIRKIAKPYIGKEFSTQKLVSLESAISSYLKAEREDGYNNGAVASISFSRTDRIMGRLTIRVRMVPPFSIESIIVETSLAAEEADL